MGSEREKPFVAPENLEQMDPEEAKRVVIEASLRVAGRRGVDRRFFDHVADRLGTSKDFLATIVDNDFALREAADRLVHEIDPVAAERRRRMAEEDRRVTFRPAEDGMAAAYALLTAHEGLELGVRVDEIAGTVCESDPRTVPQRRADGLMMLVRGFSTLGCWCAVPGCPLREARAVGDDDVGGHTGWRQQRRPGQLAPRRGRRGWRGRRRRPAGCRPPP